MKRPLRLPGFWGRAAMTVTIELALSTWAYGAGPHVHGVANLEIAIDDAAVQINLNSPLDSLLGFERAGKLVLADQRGLEELLGNSVSQRRCPPGP